MVLRSIFLSQYYMYMYLALIDSGGLWWSACPTQWRSKFWKHTAGGPGHLLMPGVRVHSDGRQQSTV